MKTKNKLLIGAVYIFSMFLFPLISFAESNETNQGDSTTVEQNSKKRKVRYISQDTLNLDSTLVQGNVLRPDVGLVVGNKDEIFDGMLRLRDNFVDHAQLSSGRSVK